ncbi:Dipeptidyl peptidase IV [Pseudoalteromonas luteoviolacea B = ATCC 29581]|nr:Dipeptidyl peptidase IV [Pseudoalteromonas luteoviolacea B = ATCC 29581]
MLKQSLLTIAMSSILLTGCQTTSAPVSTSQVTSANVIAQIQTPVDFGGENITLEQAMADPDWLGRQPESARWDSNSSNVIFNQKRKGSVVRDQFQVNVTNGAIAPVALSNLHSVPATDAKLSLDGQVLVYTFSGNVFAKNVNNGAVKQLTFSSETISIDRFLNDGRLLYRTDTTYFVLDVNSGVSKTLAKIVAADEPKGISEPNDYLSKAQFELIKYVRVQHQNAKEREAQNKAIEQENDNQFKNTIYVGNGKKITTASVSPSGDKLIVAVQEDKPSRSNHDIMPNYIAKDGNIHAVPARQRVAESKPQGTELIYVDLTTGVQSTIDYSTLPGFDEDVLAAVKAENAKAKGEKYESKRAPREINLITDWNWSGHSIQWNHDGSQVALMLEAWDNKDRWIATVNANGKTLTTQHRLHDDAWVNYNFNQFGWLHNSDTLYYLSEESGYSHVYIKPIGESAKALTTGQFEVSDLTVTKDNKFIYFKANQKHPGIYEIYRVNVASKEVQALTNLDGMTDYELSPDESKLLLTHSTIMLPPELYVADLAGDLSAKRLTHTVSDEFLNKKLIAPKIVAVPSSHGEQPVYAKVYYPADYVEGETGKTRKAVIFNHGAGYLQNSHFGWSVYFREFMFHSLLASEGYVVMDMDYRASKGYGRDWRTAIYRQMGTPETQDLVDGVKWMNENANVNTGAVGTYGGSYGGFMTFMALFTEPDLFQAGAALRPVTDWAYYNHPYTSNILNTPDVDPIAYERSSPIYFAEGLKKPLLINAPMVDDNVFFHDVVRLVQRLIELEKTDFETAIFPVEPHGFVQPSSWLDEYRRIHKLFKETL